MRAPRSVLYMYQHKSNIPPSDYEKEYELEAFKEKVNIYVKHKLIIITILIFLLILFVALIYFKILDFSSWFTAP